MNYIGIDPGKSGAVAIYDSIQKTLTVTKCPETEVGMADLLDVPTGNVICYIEKVHGGVWRKNKKGEAATVGAVSQFNFGKNYGAWLGILAAYEIKTITMTPQKWMKIFGELPKDQAKRKTEIHNRVLREFPSVKIYKYAADAVALLSTQVQIKI